MGWLIVIGILVLLALMPLGVSAAYDSSGAAVRIIVGPVQLKVFPVKKKQRKEKPPKENEGSATRKASSEGSGKRGGSLKDFLPMAQLVLEFLGTFRRKLRVDRLEANIILAGDDPCDLATNYGKAWAALGNLWPRLEEFFVIKKRDVQLQCDFTGSETLITARLDLSLTLASLFPMGVRYGIRAIRELLKIKNKGKGGATI